MRSRCDDKSTAPVRQRNPIRNRKPPLPVNVRAYFVGGATRRDVIDGAAVLSVTDIDRDEEAPYWLQAVFDGGKCVAFRLREFGGEETHTVSRDLLECDCADATYRAGSSGGCRHVRALKQALPTVNNAAEVPAPGNAA